MHVHNETTHPNRTMIERRYRDRPGLPSSTVIPRLEQGDRLTREEFERRYHAMPELKKAELIEGKVIMPSPVRLEHHGKPSLKILAWIGTYEAATPGVTGADNTTVRLDADNEAQPDGLLIIDPDCGGQTQLGDDDYLEGPPELVVEVAASSASYDLGDKMQVYRRNGVQEYLVWRVLDGEIDWFANRSGRLEPLAADDHGCIKSEVFPGLWLDLEAMLSGDLAKVLTVLQTGTATAEHAAFLEQLVAKRK